MLQLRMLRLIQRQAALRHEVEQAQQDLLTMNERSYRKHMKTMDKQNYDMGRLVDKVQAERAAALVKAGRALKSDMLDRATTQKELRIARGRGITRLHDRFLKGLNKFKEDDRTRRMDALQVKTRLGTLPSIRTVFGIISIFSRRLWKITSELLPLLVL